MFWRWTIWKKINTFTDFIAWNLFFLTFATIVIDDLISLILPDSRAFLFYSTMSVISPSTVVWYVCNVLQVLVNIIVFIPFVFYIYNRRLPFKTVWPWLMIAKVFFDITGHHFQFLEYKSFYHLKPFFGLSSALVHALIWIPSYVGPATLIMSHRGWDSRRRPG